jgi:tetratricopeptide (TPR) repeat protein
MKTNANQIFSSGDYLSALNNYTSIINLAKEIDYKEQLAILYSNRGLCFMKMNEDKKAIENFSLSISIDNKFVKAYVNRMLINNKIGEYIDSLDGNYFFNNQFKDFNKIKELDYRVYQTYRHLEQELNYKAEKKKKEMTDEVMGKLKDVGNSFLGMFGMSTDNFKLQPNGGGGYSIQFQK